MEPSWLQAGSRLQAQPPLQRKSMLLPSLPMYMCTSMRVRVRLHVHLDWCAILCAYEDAHSADRGAHMS